MLFETPPQISIYIFCIDYYSESTDPLDEDRHVFKRANGVKWSSTTWK